MAVMRKTLWGVLLFTWGYFEFSFLGGGAHFQYFSLILEKGSVFFHEILQ